MEPPSISSDWLSAIGPLLNEQWWAALQEGIRRDRSVYPVYPPEDVAFRSLQLTPLSSVKVVILGQDPYHGPGQADGLAFSVPDGTRMPPSLKNILKELTADVAAKPPASGSLRCWAQRGVLLLNTVLTVRENQPGSHATLGWERFTDAIISAVSASSEPTAFLLWGTHAKNKAPLIDLSVHFVQESAHPSPLSANRGFFGSRPFSKANDFLETHGRSGIDWQLPTA